MLQSFYLCALAIWRKNIFYLRFIVLDFHFFFAIASILQLLLQV